MTNDVFSFISFSNLHCLFLGDYLIFYCLFLTQIYDKEIQYFDNMIHIYVNIFLLTNKRLMDFCSKFLFHVIFGLFF